MTSFLMLLWKIEKPKVIFKIDMDILRFITAGNVDDGKSTLIGRLLFETDSIKSDIISSVSGDHNSAEINLAHITDGLRSERELGITIDVAYKYFSTPNRKYIITDAPGHFQYMKNMVTGSSAVDVMIILIDAMYGVTEQTKRHSLVASFLNKQHVLVAINKMDMVEYGVSVYETICSQYKLIAQKLGLSNVTYIPISALKGDNVTEKSFHMPWYIDQTILQYLETVENRVPDMAIGRLSVQYNIKGHVNFYAGKLLSGRFRVGEQVCIQPSGDLTTISKMSKGYTDVGVVECGESICISFSPDPLIARGNLVCSEQYPTSISDEFTVSICWLDAESALTEQSKYFLRINSFETDCEISEVLSKTNVHTFEKDNHDKIVNVNEFAEVRIRTTTPVPYDSFTIIPENGRGILIDKKSNFTCGAFVIYD